MYNDGVTAGLKVWLIGLGVFFVLGYPAIFAVFLGAVAGAAVCLIVTYRQMKAMPPPKDLEATRQAQLPKGFRRFGWRRLANAQDDRPSGTPSLLNNWLRRRKPPSFKSRR